MDKYGDLYPLAFRMGLLSRLGGPIEQPLPVAPPAPPPSFGPRGAAQQVAAPAQQWTSDAAMKALQEQQQALRAGETIPTIGPGWQRAAAGAVNFGKNFMEARKARELQDRAEANERMRQEAIKGAAGQTDLAKYFMGTGVPDLQTHGATAAMQAQQERAKLEFQKQLEIENFERQKKFLLEQEDARTKQLLERLRAAGAIPPEGQAAPPEGSPQAPATTPSPTTAPPVGPQAAAPVNPNATFADELLAGGGHQPPSAMQKFGIAMALGEKGKAVDALTEKGEKLTEAQTKDASFASRLLSSEADLRRVFPIDNAGNPLSSKFSPTKKSYAILPEGWNVANTKEWQSYNRAKREGLAAILRKDTGAAVTPQEFDLYGPMYYPQPGDSPQVVADKQRARILLARGLRNGSGPAFDQMFPKFNEELRARLEAQGADLTPKGPPVGERRTEGAAPKAAAAAAPPEQILKDAASIGIPADKASQIPEGGEIASKSRGKVYVRTNGRLVEKGAVDAAAQAEGAAQYAPNMPNPLSNFDESGRFVGPRR